MQIGEDYIDTSSSACLIRGVQPFSYETLEAFLRTESYNTSIKDTKLPTRQLAHLFLDDS